MQLLRTNVFLFVELQYNVSFYHFYSIKWRVTYFVIGIFQLFLSPSSFMCMFFLCTIVLIVINKNRSD